MGNYELGHINRFSYKHERDFLNITNKKVIKLYDKFYNSTFTPANGLYKFIHDYNSYRQIYSDPNQ